MWALICFLFYLFYFLTNYQHKKITQKNFIIIFRLKTDLLFNLFSGAVLCMYLDKYFVIYFLMHLYLDRFWETWSDFVRFSKLLAV